MGVVPSTFLFGCIKKVSENRANSPGNGGACTPHLQILDALVEVRFERARLHAAVPRQLPAVVLLEVVVPEHIPPPVNRKPAS